jgi:predicted metalloprotease with PDZ domain
MTRRATSLALLLLLFAVVRLPAAIGVMTVRVDARGIPGKILHSHLAIPVSPGPVSLYYPKWIPGEHGPTGPITGLAGVRFSAGGTPLPWQRDAYQMYEFHLQVPPGVESVEVDLDYLAPAPGPSFTAGASTSPRLGIVSWNTVILYPAGVDIRTLQCDATLRIPDGWKWASSLESKGGTASEISFEQVPLSRLIDSPVLTAAALRTVDIPTRSPLRHRIDMISERAGALEPPADFAASYSRLAEEAGALFGARHYRHYDWLLTLSDQVAHFGLEHHESSDDRTFENTLEKEPTRKLLAQLLAHEYVHSWNGKYRRPAGLAGSYEKPMAGELLWVYEGLTQYLGKLLPLRAGIWTLDDYRESLAATAAALGNQPGRTWRPLADTAVEAQDLYGAPEEWGSWRRGVDFYEEGVLLWLDADMTIRKLTAGKRSLDDFCRSFYGGASGKPELETYTLDDVVAALNGVAPYDWKGFLRARLQSLDPGPPMGGIEGSGWRLAYNDTPNSHIAAQEERTKFSWLVTSLGILVNKDAVVIDVIPGRPAAAAGLSPGVKIIAVNGRRFDSSLLTEAVKNSPAASGPIELIVENGQFYTTHRIDYHGGLRYPHLERDPAREDLLAPLSKPLFRP